MRGYLKDEIYNDIIHTLRQKDTHRSEYRAWEQRYTCQEVSSGVFALFESVSVTKCARGFSGNKLKEKEKEVSRAAAASTDDARYISSPVMNSATESMSDARQLVSRRTPRESELDWIIKSNHTELGHASYEALHKHIEQVWKGVPRILCQAYAYRCDVCSKRMRQQPPVSGFLSDSSLATAPLSPAQPVSVSITEDAAGSKRKAETDHTINSNITVSSEHDRGNKRARGGRGGGSNTGAAATDAGHTTAASSSASVPSVPLTPLQSQFSLFATYLDGRNDRREFIVQKSRDLTRASKKLISQLQRLTHVSAEERQRQLASAHSTDLSALHRMLNTIVSDFKPEEFYRYSNACSPGIQEFIESASFLHYLQYGTLLTHSQLEFDIAATIGHSVSIPLSDYLLGMTDLGGELMRYATNSVTRGEEGRATVASIATFLRDVHAHFQQLIVGMNNGNGNVYRELSKKMDVWLQSLLKIETVQFRLHMRRAEFPDAVLDELLMHDLTSGRVDADQRDEEAERVGWGATADE
jgi:predicted translin family RNA/ssDNA-binding protein